MDDFPFKAFKDFIGKTIEDVEYCVGWLNIKFTDGTFGCVQASLPPGTDMKQFFLSGGVNPPGVR